MSAIVLVTKYRVTVKVSSATVCARTLSSLTIAFNTVQPKFERQAEATDSVLFS